MHGGGLGLPGRRMLRTLEYSGQIIRVSDYDKPSNLGVTITKRGNAEALAGSQMRYDFTVANTWHSVFYLAGHVDGGFRGSRRSLGESRTAGR